MVDKAALYPTFVRSKSVGKNLWLNVLGLSGLAEPSQLGEAQCGMPKSSPIPDLDQADVDRSLTILLRLAVVADTRIGELEDHRPEAIRTLATVVEAVDAFRQKAAEHFSRLQSASLVDEVAAIYSQHRHDLAEMRRALEGLLSVASRSTGESVVDCLVADDKTIRENRGPIETAQKLVAQLRGVSTSSVRDWRRALEAGEFDRIPAIGVPRADVIRYFFRLMDWPEKQIRALPASVFRPPEPTDEQENPADSRADADRSDDR